MEQSFLLEKELADKVVKIIGTDYYGKLELKDITNIIKDLVCQYHVLEEKLEDQVEHCKEYHVEKQIDYYDEYGISPSDFV